MIYADNAATSWPKPPSVIAEMVRAVELYGANPGRSSHSMGAAAERTVYNCRKAVASLFNALPENVVFTQNATAALNTAVLGCVVPGQHIIISDIEHNSLFRPVVASGCEYTVFSTYEENDDLTVSSILASVKPNTALIAVTAAGNLTASRLPIAKIGAAARERGIAFVVDASQAAGHFSIDMQRDNIDILCAPGHKGLMGPQGSGVMVLNGKLPQPILFGGSGAMSALPYMPDLPPERFEAGTLNTPAIAGLWRGIEYISSVGIEKIGEYERRLARNVFEKLSEWKEISLVGGYPQGGIVSFNIQGMGSEQACSALNKAGVLARAGLHCSPLAHKKYNTLETGAVRLSFGCFNTEAHAKKILQIIKNLI